MTQCLSLAIAQGCATTQTMSNTLGRSFHFMDLEVSTSELLVLRIRIAFIRQMHQWTHRNLTWHLTLNTQLDSVCAGNTV